MRSAESKSWRFAHDFDQSLHTLLYIRDAVGLEIEAAPGIPPRLAADIPDRSELLDPTAKAEAAQDWSAWWHYVVASRVEADFGGESATQEERRHNFVDRHRSVFDPPAWSSLSDRSALQAAARTLWRESCEWFTAARRPHLPPRSRDVLSWEHVRDAAEAIAAAQGVPVGAINGSALVLVVEGNWWELAAPGAALCSVLAATDPDTTRAILTRVFQSRLAA